MSSLLTHQVGDILTPLLQVATYQSLLVQTSDGATGQSDVRDDEGDGRRRNGTLGCVDFRRRRRLITAAAAAAGDHVCLLERLACGAASRVPASRCAGDERQSQGLQK